MGKSLVTQLGLETKDSENLFSSLLEGRRSFKLIFSCQSEMVQCAESSIRTSYSQLPES